MVTDEELHQIAPRLKADKRKSYLPLLNAAMQEFKITSYLREAAFLAQLLHESGELRWFEELASGAAYEGRRDLGNVQPGDGRRFKGRGPIQLTGRNNYSKAGQALGLDLLTEPELAATPKVGFRVAGWFWASRNLNIHADNRDFLRITELINGGRNGLSDRMRYYERALAVLSRDEEPVDKKLAVNGKEIRGSLLQRDSRIMTPVRSTCLAAGWRLEVMDGIAKVFADGEWFRLPMANVGGTGYVFLREMPWKKLDYRKDSDIIQATS